MNPSAPATIHKGRNGRGKGVGPTVKFPVIKLFGTRYREGI